MTEYGKNPVISNPLLRIIFALPEQVHHNFLQICSVNMSKRTYKCHANAD